MKKIIAILVMTTLCSASVFAQNNNEKEHVKFNRHWYIQAQAGAGYTIGETDFGKLVAPAAALSAGYQISPIWGLRLGISGWQSKGAILTPENANYKFNYLQGNLDVTLDLANLFGKFNAKRTVNPYLFAGIGVNGAFNNDEAVAIQNEGASMKYIWDGHKVFAAGRLGVGVNFRLSDHVLVGLEANTNMLSDKYNSKKGGNVDWQINALAGFTFRIGKNYKKIAAAPAPVAVPPTEPAPKTEEPVVEPTPAPAPAKVIETPKAEPTVENIFFTIRSTQIGSSQQAKLAKLTDFLKANPSTKISLVGYADAATGTTQINNRLSQRRAEAVSKALQQNGIAADRITTDFKGATEQPFSEAKENRVVICIAE